MNLSTGKQRLAKCMAESDAIIIEGSSYMEIPTFSKKEFHFPTARGSTPQNTPQTPRSPLTPRTPRNAPNIKILTSNDAMRLSHVDGSEDYEPDRETLISALMSLLRFSLSVNMHADVDIPIVNDHILKTKEARLINNLLEPIKILKRQNRGREDFFARRGEKNSPRGAEGAEQGPPPPALTSITLM